MAADRDKRPRDMAAAIELLQPIVVQLSAKGGKAPAAARQPAWLVPASAGAGGVLVLGLLLAVGLGGKKQDATVAVVESPLADASPTPAARATPAPAVSSAPVPQSTPSPVALVPSPAPVAPSIAPAPAVATPVASPTPAPSPSPEPTPSIAPAPTPTPIAAPSADPGPAPSSNVPDERAEAAAEIALTDARTLAPAESADKLASIVRLFGNTRAGASARIEQGVVADLANALDKTKQSLDAFALKLDFDGSEKALKALEHSIEGSYASELKKLTGVAGVDARVKGAKDIVALRRTELGQLKRAKDALDHAFSEERVPLKEALTKWKPERAEEKLVEIRELDRKLATRGGPSPDARIEVCEAILHAASAVMKAAGGADPRRPKWRPRAPTRSPSS